MAAAATHGVHIWDLPMRIQLADALAGRALPSIQYGVPQSKSWEWMAVLFNVNTGTYPFAQNWNTEEKPQFKASQRELAETCYTELERYIRTYLQLNSVPRFEWLCQFRVLHTFSDLIRRGILNHGPMMGWAVQAGDSFYEKWEAPMPRRQGVPLEREYI